MVEHFLPGGVKLTAVLLQQPLLSQGDGLLRCPQNLHRPLKLLSGLLGFNLGLKFKREGGNRVILAQRKPHGSSLSFQVTNMLQSSWINHGMIFYWYKHFGPANARETFVTPLLCISLYFLWSVFPRRSHSWSLATAIEWRRHLALRARTHTDAQTQRDNHAVIQQTKALSLKKSDTSSVGSPCPHPEWRGGWIPSCWKFLDPLLTGMTEKVSTLALLSSYSIKFFQIRSRI